MQDVEFTSANFLWQAKGPLAPMFRSYIGDPRGAWRLDHGNMKYLWETHTQRAIQHYRFNDTQVKQAQAALATRLGQLKWYLDDNNEDIVKFKNEWARLDAAMGDSNLRGVAFRQSWIQEKEAELRKMSAPWYKQVAAIRKALEGDLYAVHSAENAPTRRKFAFPDPGHSSVDTIITWLTFLVGVCLVLGLFTRVASIAGALFLFSVILTQPPWVAGAAPVYYQTVEMLALLVLAAIGAGRYAGLDFILHSLWLRIRRPRKPALAEGA